MGHQVATYYTNNYDNVTNDKFHRKLPISSVLLCGRFPNKGKNSNSNGHYYVFTSIDIPFLHSFYNILSRSAYSVHNKARYSKLEDSETMPDPIDAWLSKFNPNEMPVLQSSLKLLEDELAFEDLDYKRLASVVLSDPALLVRTLMNANQQSSRRMSHSITGIDQAMMMLGDSKIRRIYQNLPILETSYRKEQEYILPEIQTVYERAHHAAFQAMDWLRRCGDLQPGEIYTTTMLHSMGEIIIWLTEPHKAVMIQQLIQSNQAPAMAEKEILGFSIGQLTRRAAEKWGLSDMLVDILSPEHRFNQRSYAISLAIRLARMTRQGWYYDKLAYCIKDIARYLGRGLDNTIALLHYNAAISARHRSYGVLPAAGMLPFINAKIKQSVWDNTLAQGDMLIPDKLPDDEQSDYLHELLAHIPSDDFDDLDYLLEIAPQASKEDMDIPSLSEVRGDAYLSELEIRDGDDRHKTYFFSYETMDREMMRRGEHQHTDNQTLTQVLEALELDINRTINVPGIMRTVMKGMHDGIGLTRVFYAELAPDFQTLQTRAVLCHEHDPLFNQLHIDLYPANLFTKLMQKPQAIWVNHSNREKMIPLLPTGLRELLETDSFFALSLFVNDKPRGLFFADRYEKDPLTETSYRFFKRLSHTAMKALGKLVN